MVIMCKFQLVLLICVVPMLSNATDFRVTQTNQRFILETDKCPALREEVEAIASWTRTLGESVKPVEVDCGGTSATRVDITEILPAQFKKLSGKYAICYGPNCFNAALIGHGLHSQPRSVGQNEMTLTLELFCRDISSAGETPIPGDIGVIRNHFGKKFEEVHAFNFIRETVATKNGESISASLQIQDRDDMFKTYGVDQKCRDPRNSGRCARYVSYYRCDPQLVKREDVDDFEHLEHMLAESLYNKDMAGELSALEDLFELVQGRLSAKQADIVKAKIESIDYQLKRMQPEHEEFLLDVLKRKKTEKYETVRAFLRRAIRAKAGGKSLPYSFKPVVQLIIENAMAEFDTELNDALPSMSPVLKKKVLKHLKIDEEQEEER